MPLPKRFPFKRVPFLPILIPFILGICIANLIHIKQIELVLVISIIVTCYASLWLFPPHLQYALRLLRSGFIFLIFLLLGCFRCFNQQPYNHSNFIGLIKNPTAYTIRLKESLVEKSKSWKALAEVESVLIDGMWKSANGKILLYLKKDSVLPKLDIGSRLLFTKQLTPIKNAGNPGEFDYQKYSANKGLFYQLFLGKAEYSLLPKDSSFSFSKILNFSRRRVIQKIDENISNSEARAVAKALLIGYRNDLDKDMLQAFANAGVIHIIAISGLHLMIITGLFVWLLMPLKRFRYGKQLSILLDLILAWVFTFIAGAVPSVTRAAIMITIYLLAGIFQRKANVYNTLAVAAFILLIYNPYYLWDVGFLLSFAAVLSIALFYKPILSILKVENKILYRLWNVAAVSIAAQILTLPIVLYFFHRFPNLFIFANIVAVSLSGIILYAEIIMLALTPIAILAKFVGNFVQILILGLDKFIQFIAKIPFAITENLTINEAQMFFLIIAIFSVYLFFILRKRIFPLTAFFCLLACLIINLVNNNRLKGQCKVLIYNTSRSLVIDFIMGNYFWSVSDKLFSKNADEYKYVLKPARDFYKVHFTNNLPELIGRFPHYKFKNKQIFIINKQSISQLPIDEKIDIFIVSESVMMDFPFMQEKFPKALLVFAAKNSMWKIERWKKQCDSLHLHFHSVPEEGAFVMNL